MERDVERIFESATRAYERGRIARGFLMAVPLPALAVLATWLGTNGSLALALGTGSLFAAAFFHWRGQALGRAVFPGIIAGAVPLALALCARSYGHMCTENGCVSLCVPACTLGGVAAGVMIARASKHVARRGAFLGASFTVAALVGALGCSCVGYGGIAGLVMGLGVSVLPVWIPALRARGE